MKGASIYDVFQNLPEQNFTSENFCLHYISQVWNLADMFFKDDT